MILKNIRFSYLRTDSVLDRMDALSKLIIVIVLSIAVYFYKNPLELLPMPIILFVLSLALGKVKLPVAFWSFMVFVTFGLFVAFFQLLSHQSGDYLYKLGIFKITPSGLYLAELFVLRLTTIGSAALLFLWTTSPKNFTTALVYLGVPYRFAFAVLVALRFLPLIQDDISKIKDAHLIRGMKQEKGIEGIFNNWQRYMFPILVDGLRKAETTSIAMDSRGFGLYKTRTYTEYFSWTKSGVALAVCIIVLILGIGFVWGFGFDPPRYNI